MIESIDVFIGKVHKHLPEKFWKKLGAELSEKYDCDLVMRTVDEQDTRIRVNGDLSPDDMLDPLTDLDKYFSSTRL
jgi:hypothetical protein